MHMLQLHQLYDSRTKRAAALLCTSRWKTLIQGKEGRTQKAGVIKNNLVYRQNYEQSHWLDLCHCLMKP